MADGEVKIDTKLDTSGLDKGLKNMNNKLGGAGKKLDVGAKKGKGFADNLKGISTGAVAAGVAVAGAAVAVKKTVDALNACTAAYRVQAKAETQLETAAKNNPFLLSSSVSSLKNYASELQSISTIGDEELIPFMAQLASAGRTQEEIQDIMKVSVDIAASGSMSLESAVRNLNKTYGGYAGELGETIPQVKALTAEQLKNGEAVKVLGAQYDGMAKEVSKATGTSDQLKNAWGDLKEELGASMEKEMGPIRSFFTELVSGWANAKKAKREYDEAVEGIKSGDKSLANLETVQNNTERQIEIYKKLIQQMKDFKTKYEDSIGTENDYSKKWFSGTEFSDMKYDPTTESIYNEFKIEEVMDRIKTEIGSDASEFKVNFRFNDEDLKEFERKLRALQQQRDKAENVITAETNKELETQKDLEAEQKAIELQTTKRDILQKITEEREKQLNLLELQAQANGIEVDKTKVIEAYAKSYVDLISQSNGLYTQQSKEVTDITSKIKELSEEYKNLQDFQNFETELTNIITADQKEEKDKLKESEKMKEEVLALEIYYASLGKDEKIKIQEEYLSSLEILKDKQKEMEEKENAEEIQRTKELVAEKLSLAGEFASQYAEITNTITALVKEQAENESKIKTSELEKQYAEGLMSEEEYTKKKEDIERAAAQKQYRANMWEWTASLLTTTANIAQGISKAIADGGVPAGIIMGALVGAAGAAQIATLIANKPIPPSFTTGGIVGGSSYSGDNIAANLNSREMIMNMGQQKALWDFINGGGNGGGNVTNIKVYNTASNDVVSRPEITEDGIKIMIRKTVNQDMSEGRFNSSMRTAQGTMNGVSLTN